MVHGGLYKPGPVFLYDGYGWLFSFSFYFSFDFDSIHGGIRL